MTAALQSSLHTVKKHLMSLTKNVRCTNFGGMGMKFGFLDTYHPEKFV
ncbi:hypothetical protein AGRO_3031 [Agrobacterium sp. ATCC 31749]|nr:hypothetical protein AGRO_3031 [Agrobacterium sp. ATCC 31749]